jgi:hypothetical protein
VRGKEAFLTGLVAASLIGASPAHAACDWPVAKAKATHHLRSTPAPLAIGDSTMLFSVDKLARLGFDVNARACRSWAEGLDLVEQRKRAGRLPSFVVMALGANSTLRPIDVQRALKLIGPTRTLGLPTHRTWFGKPGADTGVIRRMARRYPERIQLMDWVHYAKPHPAWFVNDGLHTNDIGSRKFATFLAQSLPS